MDSRKGMHVERRDDDGSGRLSYRARWLRDKTRVRDRGGAFREGEGGGTCGRVGMKLLWPRGSAL